MLESKNNQELMDLVMNNPGATEEELVLAERLSSAIAELDRLTELVRTLQEAASGADA